ncbi:MAG: hypothetical protein IJN54_07815 [Lachnospiraceae bacterium]|nr:hypothetical protein [Lachnospiraceae bacterium]
MEKSFWKKHEKAIFWITVGCAFLAIALFNFLTPNMSDDYNYGRTVRGMDKFVDILKSEYVQYMNWTGRSVNHIILKVFLKMDKWVFNLCNSANFVALTLLIYYNIEGKKKFNAPIYILINLFLWIFGVEFGETVLWETGACNYLWGTTTIVGFVSLFKFACDRADKMKRPVLWGILLFFAGVVAGWCNENTSGGGILLILVTMGSVWMQKRKIKPWMWSGLAGMLTGFCFMVAAPGNSARAMYAEDNYGGIVKYIARAYKITLAIEENFLVLLLILLVLFLLARAQKRTWKELSGAIVYLVVAIATCYALVLAPTPMNRAYFGAGVFLIMAVIQCFVKITEEEIFLRAAKQSFIYGLLLYMAFSYVDNIVNTARIYRDYTNREQYILEQKAAGNRQITVPLLHEGFESEYSFGYTSDFGEGDEYWVNRMACSYYDVNSLYGVPMEEWTEY